MSDAEEIERLRAELARQYAHRRKQNDEIEQLRRQAEIDTVALNRYKAQTAQARAHCTWIECWEEP